MHSVRFIAILLLANLLNLASRAQSAPAATPATPVSTPEVPVLRTSANLVLVDVVATEHGNAVHGLGKQQFHVFEDGREQTISSFEEHRPPAGPVVAVKPLVLPPNTYSNIPKYAEDSPVNVLLLDALNTPMEDQMEVRRQMIQYLGKIPPGTPLAVFTLASRLRLVEGFITDVAALVKAVQKAKTRPQPSGIVDPQNTKMLDTMEIDISQGWENPDTAVEMLQFQADLAAFQADQRVRMTIEAMEQLARYLSVIPGRKNLIWFSASFPLAIDPDTSLRSPYEAMRNYSDQMKGASEMLAAARVAVYPVDARGLVTMPSYDASYAPVTGLTNTSGSTSGGTHSGTSTQGLKNIATSRPGSARDNKNAMRELETSQEGMKLLAAETGGQAFINTNGLKEAVAHAIENGSSYYTIGYSPAAKEYNGEYRKIQVRLDSGNSQLAYRQGYYADSPDKPSAHLPATTSPITAAIQNGAPPASQILFKARVLPATDPLLHGSDVPDTPGELAATLKKPVQRYVVDLVVVPRSLAFEPMPDGARQARIELALAAYDTEGNRVNYLGRSYSISLNPEQFARTLVNGVRARMALDLPAGQISLRIAIQDLSAGHLGALEVPLAIAAK